jgi:hypothetical protein
MTSHLLLTIIVIITIISTTNIITALPTPSPTALLKRITPTEERFAMIYMYPYTFDTGKTICTQRIKSSIVPAYIANLAENDQIQTAMIETNVDSAWIGLVRDSTGAGSDFYWLAHPEDDVVYTNWATGQPNNQDLCVKILSDGTWKSEACDNTLQAVVCQGSHADIVPTPTSYFNVPTTSYGYNPAAADTWAIGTIIGIVIGSLTGFVLLGIAVVGIFLCIAQERRRKRNQQAFNPPASNNNNSKIMYTTGVIVNQGGIPNNNNNNQVIMTVPQAIIVSDGLSKTEA